MPFYEYECPSCRHYAEVMQKISDAPLKKCPACGKAGFKRLISAPVFRLKGSGWYETDFKSDKEGKRNLAGGDKDDVRPAVDSKTDSATPAAKSEPAAPKPAAKGKSSRTGTAARTAKKAPARRAGGNKAAVRHK